MTIFFFIWWVFPGLLGIAMVRLFGLPWWLALSPYVVVWVGAGIRGLWDYYRKPMLLSGGRTAAQLKKDKTEANKPQERTSQ